MPSSSQLSLHELHFNLGHVLHRQGDLMGAARSYRQVIALQPDCVNAHLNLAIVLDEQAQFSAAAHHYRQVIALKPDSVQAYNNLGCTLIKLRELDAAMQAYQQAIDLHPNWATLYNNLGQVLQAQSKSADAIAAYRRAIELQPDLALAHHNLGKVLQFQGHHARAIACFQQVIQLEPDHRIAYSDCGASWMAQGQLEQALPYLHQAVVQQSKFVEAYWQWTAELSDRESSAAEKDELTQAKIACGQFLHALHHQPNSPALCGYLAQTYLHLGHALRVYGGEGQLRQAQTYYQFALQLQPTCLPAYLGLGECLVKQEKHSAAILVYHLALTHCPNPVSLHVQLGQTLERQEKFAEAIGHYRQALQARQSDRFEEWIGGWIDGRVGSEETRLEQIPQGSYPSTQDWIAATRPDSTHYTKLHFSHSHLYEFPFPSSTIRLSTHGEVHPPIPPSPHPPTCHGLNCQPCLKQLFNRFEPIHLGKGIYTFAMTSEWATQTPLFVATIGNGRVWTAPQQNHWRVCNAIAVITPDRYLLSDLSRDYPGQLPGCQHPPSDHAIFQQENLPALEKIAGTVAVLTGLSGHNYYHWMVDILPRLSLLQASGLDLSQVDWFLVNSIRQLFQRATLEALGVPLEKIIASDRHSHIQASQLVVPSFAGCLGWLEPWGLEFLRQQFLPLAERSALPTPYPERIYISRAQATHRRVLNEAEVVEQLTAYGFVSIQLESLSFIDQIALFANARIIVTPHGGGLTNLVFCRSQTTVVELVNLNYIRHYYLTISQQLGLQHYLVAGEVFTCYPLRQLMYPSPLMEDIWVNLESLTRLLQGLSE